MRLKERYNRVIEYFLANVPEPETELGYDDPFGLLVAVILSAQCTDKRVNMITPALLEAYPDAKAMSMATQSEVFEFIKSCSYPNNKAKHLVGMAKMLIQEFNGIVPGEPQQLQQLPGVGGKTANVIASVVFKKPVMAVDTHVFRVARRIGLASGAKTPLDVELILSKNIPLELIRHAHHWLILHGRYVCFARKPLCEKCGLTNACEYYMKNRKNDSNTSAFG